MRIEDQVDGFDFDGPHGGVVPAYVVRGEGKELVHAEFARHLDGLGHFVDVVLKGEKAPGEDGSTFTQQAALFDQFADVLENDIETAVAAELLVDRLGGAVD